MADSQVAKPSAEDASLFVKTTPNLLMIVFPGRWVWHFLTRRFGIFNAFASDWNGLGDKEPLATKLADGIMYGEGPRFRVKENALYYSDMYGKKVFKYELGSKRVTTVYESDEYLSGLGWLPDDRLLIVAMNTRRILALDQTTSKMEEYADVSAVTRFRTNDFVVDVSGRAYVGNFGFDFTDPMSASTTTLVRIDTDQSVHVDATGMFFPNGSVITPDGKTLIIAETFSGILTAFDIGKDGALSNRRVWANIGLPCDGIALDAEGCVWVAIPHVGIHKTAGALVRVREGGEVVNLFGFGMNGVVNSVFACQLGTDATTGKHMLFFLEAISSEEHVVLKNGPEEAKKNTVLKSIEVAVGPARIQGNERYCGGYC